MRTVLITAVSTAVCAFLAAAPAFAQDTVTGAPAGQAPATVEGYGYGQGQTGQPGIGSDYPAYYGYAPGYRYYWPGYGYYAPSPFGPVGAAVGALGSAAGALTSGAVGVATGGPAYVARRHCHVYRDEYGRRICGP